MHSTTLGTSSNFVSKEHPLQYKNIWKFNYYLAFYVLLFSTCFYFNLHDKNTKKYYYIIKIPYTLISYNV